MKSRLRLVLAILLLPAWPALLGGLDLGNLDFSRWTTASKVDKAWVVVIDDGLDRSADAGHVFGDKAFWDSLKPACEYRLIDSENKDAEPYKASITEAGGLPTLILASRDGNSTRLATIKLTPDLQNKDSIRSIVGQYVKGVGQ